MPESGDISRQAIYDLYDRHHAALRAGDSRALHDAYAPSGTFSSRDGGDSVIRTDSQLVVSHLIGKVNRVTGPLHTGLDVYAVGLRGNEAVVVLEEWIDDVDRGTRETRFALETVRRSGDGAWRISRSASEETTSKLA